MSINRTGETNKAASRIDPVEQVDRRSGLFSKVDLRGYTMVIALVTVWVIFATMTDGKFLTPRNVALLFRQMAIPAILATGMVLVIVPGQIDLSVGSLAALTSGTAAILQVWYGWSTPAVVVVALGVGLVAGLWQGIWVAKAGVPSFIITLGGMLVFRGVILLITKGKSISGMEASFKLIGQGFVPAVDGWVLAAVAIAVYLFLLFRGRASRIKYGFPVPPMWRAAMTATGVVVMILAVVGVMNAYEGVPVPVLILVSLVIIFSFVAEYTPFGRYLYAIGGNRDAARLSGINIDRNIIAVFVLMGLLAGTAGLVLTARLSGFGSNSGSLFELDAIAAAVIGGTSLMGGEGTVARATIGALVMASLDNGMSLMNTEAFWQYVVKGLILMVAVWVDMASKKRKA